MQRKVFDFIASAGGAVMVVVLVVAGGLLMWGYSFTNSSVHNQLAQQQITFPSAAAFAHAKAGTEVTPGMRPYLLKYAGQPLTTGAQAEAYADHFIAVHLSEMPLGGIYANVSTASRANPTNKALAAEVQTSFQGTTLRGLLLEAYAFSEFGLIALWGAIASFALARSWRSWSDLGSGTHAELRRTPRLWCTRSPSPSRARAGHGLIEHRNDTSKQTPLPGAAIRWPGQGRAQWLQNRGSRGQPRCVPLRASRKEGEFRLYPGPWRWSMMDGCRCTSNSSPPPSLATIECR